ncbi:sulfatase-like hydrolase/transferase [Dorea longicatena]|jgi:phosphoglycerol transferase MdoB-like AlkP superfamily enzyme|uniref:Sulfatase-like hydrolase/transferase n=1 Tax=Dorea longicatena TaxID=88431 RepID=A0A6N9JT07_9FIRM|nr:LTA synthase family protein [Dorea longicatena]MZK06970.1 sulfatase-like hydrolase/transferase [Dorea longicatena]MZK09265.1 sulfatase-like hydrolase/transferase [Dorea longicatena]MZK45939.1 sulfatase-like hydrolase/transferase [Dorea longicatena]NSE49956.1 sulfatase-like hydrolase/transferase [Dorea longicatena]NSE56952.1 sulfatase-like hydrolase/transferase [Dorea longicatena]
MKKLQLKKPDIKGKIRKIKNLKKEDVIAYWKGRHERRERILEARRNSAFAKKMQPVYAFMNRFSLIFHALLACIINFVIEAISRHSVVAAWDYMTGTPMVFLYNAFMIFVTFSIVYLFKRRIFVRMIIGAIWVILGIANGYILLKRVTPFNAQDLKIAGDGIALINNYCNGFEVVVIAVGAVALLIWLISMWRRGGQYAGKIHHIAALIGIIVCGVLYTFVTNIAIDKRVVSTYFGNIAFAYEDYGLPYCFSASLFNTGISEPNGYTKKAMAKIDKDGELNQTAASRSSDELPNIIVVQLESYFDVANAEFFTTSEDACPNLHNLYQNYSNGYFKVPSVGAGTANTEFEVLTGMNLRYFGPGEYPYKTYSKKHPTESAATALASLGYGTHALHDNTGNFYSRANVFNNMGFDTFTSKEFMNVLQTTENGWAKDEILTQHIMEAMDTTKQEDFVFTVSVQGHGNYPETQVIENPKIKVEGIEDEALKNKWEYYVNQVYEMDQFVGDLIKAVEERNEPSVVVFYGDHLPTMGLKAEDLKSRYLYNTNYVIWDNIGLQKDDKNIPAYQLMSEVLNRLDIHSGTVFNYHQQRKGTKNYLSDLELLQYDILYGKQYVYNGKAPITEGHMVMGIRNVSLSSIVPQLNSGYSLYGENFTKYSRVYVNGEKQKSSFLNNTRINLSETELKDGDVIQVGQVGSSDTIFRMSDKYTYQNGQLVKQEGTATDKSKSWVDQDYDVN